MALFLLCLFVFNANLRFTGSYDSLASATLPLRLLEGKGLSFEEPSGLLPGTDYSIVRSRQGGWISFYPIVTPLLVTPLYVPAVVWGRAHPFTNPDVAFAVMEKVAASTVTAASVAVLFVLLRRLTHPRLAALLALAFAFGTCTWAISSQALWQHGTAGLLLASTLLLMDATRPASALRLASAGLATGLMAANRPTDVVFWVAAGFILFRRHRLRSWPFFAASTVIGTAALAWNLYHFGAFTGGYGVYTGPDGRLVGQNQFGLPGMLGILFSNRGLFVFSPFLLLSAAWRPRADGSRFPGLGYLLIAYAISLYLHGQSFDWAGGTCYGARYALHGLPLLFVAMVGPLERIVKKAWGRVFLGVTLTFAVAIQVIGVVCYPGDDSGNWRNHGLWTVRGAPPVVALRSGLENPHFLYPFVRTLSTAQPLRGSSARGQLLLEGPSRTAIRTGEVVKLRFHLINLSSSNWSSLGGYFSRGAVELRAGFGRSGTEGIAWKKAWISARLRPGQSATVRLSLPAPAEPGVYSLVAEVFQVGYGTLPPGELPPVHQEVRIGAESALK